MVLQQSGRAGNLLKQTVTTEVRKMIERGTIG
jgi:hypothetical protein